MSRNKQKEEKGIFLFSKGEIEKQKSGGHKKSCFPNMIAADKRKEKEKQVAGWRGR